ncbi:hypothetical protein CB1_002653006 [Camelus ferus]|nr:hypothetical protein CB1_002653006 [Camelus ferus]
MTSGIWRNWIQTIMKHVRPTSALEVTSSLPLEEHRSNAHLGDSRLPFEQEADPTAEEELGSGAEAGGALQGQAGHVTTNFLTELKTGMWREVCAKAGKQSDAAFVASVKRVHCVVRRGAGDDSSRVTGRSDAAFVASVKQVHCVVRRGASDDSSRVTGHSYLWRLFCSWRVMAGVAAAPEVRLWCVAHTVS